MWRKLIWLIVGAWMLFGGWARAADYRLSNGNVIQGEVASFNENGVVFQLDSGGFSERILWIRFDQPTLKKLARNPKMRQYAEPFIEAPPEDVVKQLNIPVTEVERPQRPKDSPGLMEAFFSTPAGLVIVVLLFVANVYAGFEVARYRQRPTALVCSVSAVLPVLGPIMFLSLPTASPPFESAEDYAAGEAPGGIPPPLAEAGRKTTAAVKAGTSSFRQVGVPSGGGLSLKQDKAGPAKAQGPQIYRRGEFTINRQFIERKFAGFFRVVPGEAEKDMVLVVKGPRNEFVARRISRISATDLHLQLLSGGEKSIPLGEIGEIRVRHKDDRS